MPFELLVCGTDDRDAAVVICSQEPGAYTGNILYDELVMRNEDRLSEAAVMHRYPVQP